MTLQEDSILHRVFLFCSLFSGDDLPLPGLSRTPEQRWSFTPVILDTVHD